MMDDKRTGLIVGGPNNKWQGSIIERALNQSVNWRAPIDVIETVSGSHQEVLRTFVSQPPTLSDRDWPPSIARVLQNSEAKMNSSAIGQQLCALPTQHAQNHPLKPAISGLSGENRPTTNRIVINGRMLVANETPPTSSHQMISEASQHLLNDPYIDAVQVRSRSQPERRGTRMRAGLSPMESRESYYKKLVHLEENKEHKSAWNVKTNDAYDVSDDSDLDSDTESNHDDRDVYEHHAGKRKRIHVKKKRPYKRRKKKMGQHKHGNHHDKHDYHHHHHHRKPPEKVIYEARVVHGPKSVKHNYHDHHHAHGGYHDHGEGKHAKNAGGLKLVYLDARGRKQGGGHSKFATNKMRLAGLLGYTLLCVNYLLVARQSSHQSSHHQSDYDHGHYFATYSPDLKGMKASGPVILAHCSELKVGANDQQLLQTLASSSDLNITSSNQLATESIEKRLAASTDLYYNLFAGSNGRSAPILAARNPPAFHHHTLAPVGGVGAADRPALISPIQDYLNGILLPTTSSADRRRQRLQFAQFEPVPRRNSPSVPVEGFSGGGGRGPSSASRLMMLDELEGDGDGQPQVVGTRDNLAGLRARQTNISLRVTDRNRFVAAGPQRSLRLVAGQDAARTGPMLTPTSVATDTTSGDTNSMQADQPAARTQTDTNNDSGNNEAPPSPSNNLVLDLPEFALAGDSIQLTCNHRIGPQRLYSVKWFKDSFEFYRFIPANGARAKSALFLPEIRIDLQRSNSESLYLRNVTHRTSGLYRCEAVSEGPNFDMVSGERRMQVYALPDSGPRMSLVERAEVRPASTPPPLGSLLAGTPPSAVPPNQRETNRNDDEDTTADGDRMRAGQQGTAVLSGPIVQCQSARSSPVAQLRLFINERPLEQARTIENSTVSYSDGMESNLVSFRISMDDFRLVMDEDSSRLDKAAAGSLKSNSSLPKTAGLSTATTTPRPAVMKPNLSANKKQNANANVVFDDENSKLDWKRQKQPSSGAARKRPANSKRKDQVTRPNVDLAGVSNHEQTNDQEKQLHQAAAASSVDLARLPVGGDKQPAAANQEGEQEQQRLARMEQRAGPSADSYSNYIRVKCTSLVPAVGYEMTSELSAPLTLLVAARQLVPDGGQSLDARTSSSGGPGERETTTTNGGRSSTAAGSLQAPRAVLIDRLAQASGPNERLSPANSSSSAKQHRYQVLSNTKRQPTAFSQRLSNTNANASTKRPAVSNGSRNSPLDLPRSFLSLVSHQLILLCLLATIQRLP